MRGGPQWCRPFGGAGPGLLLIAGILGACGEGVPAVPGDAAQARKKITVAMQPFLTQAPLLLARADSFFAQEGLEVEFVKVANSTDAIPSLINGDLDVLPASANPGLFNAMARDLPVRIVGDRGFFDSTGCTTTAIAVTPGKLEAIRANPRLVKRISVERQFGMQYIIEKSLASVGLHLDSLDSKFVPPLPEAEALAKGTLDAAFLGEPWIARDVAGGKAVVWIRAEQVLPNAQTGYVFFGPSILARDRDLGQRFMVAYRRGVAKLLEGKTPENVAIMARETGDTPDLVRQQCWPALHRDGRVDLASTMDYQRWLQQKGLVATLATTAQMWDSTFVVHADAVLRSRDGDRSQKTP